MNASLLTTTDETAALLQRLGASRDPDAWAVLVEMHGEAVWRVCLSVSHDPSLAEDAAQETFLQLRDDARGFQARPGDRGMAARNWIMRIAFNTAMNLLRSRRRAQKREDIRRSLAASDDGGRAADHATVLAVREALREMPDDVRVPLTLRFFAGFDHEQIAAALDVTPAAAKKRVQRGIERLRDQLAAAGLIFSPEALSRSFAEGGSTQWMTAGPRRIARWRECLNSPIKASIHSTPLGGIPFMVKCLCGLSAAVLASAATLVCTSAPTADVPAPIVAKSASPTAAARKTLEAILEELKTHHKVPMDRFTKDFGRRVAGFMDNTNWPAELAKADLSAMFIIGKINEKDGKVIAHINVDPRQVALEKPVEAANAAKADDDDPLSDFGRMAFDFTLASENGEWKVAEISAQQLPDDVEASDANVPALPLRPIVICRLYAEAQELFRRAEMAGHRPQAYAQSLLQLSNADLKDCNHALLRGMAAAEPRGDVNPVPWNGLCFRVLKAQGPAATGGEKSYLDAKGDMTEGYALVAYPQVYDSGSPFTYIINSDGSTFKKDLGADTRGIAEKMTQFNPDATWELERL